MPLGDNIQENNFFSFSLSENKHEPIIRSNFSPNEMRGNFRIVNQPTIGLKKHWYAFRDGLQLFSTPLGLNLLVSLIVTLLVASITLLQKIPLDYYLSEPDKLIVFLHSSIQKNTLTTLEEKLNTHPLIKAIYYVPSEKGFERLLAGFKNYSKPLGMHDFPLIKKADYVPAVFEVNLVITNKTQWSELLELVKHLKSLKGVDYIQFNEANFKAFYNHSITYQKRIDRAIALLFIISILVMTQYLYLNWYRSQMLLPCCYSGIGYFILITGINSLFIKRIGEKLASFFIIATNHPLILPNNYYQSIILNSLIILVISFSGVVLMSFGKNTSKTH